MSVYTDSKTGRLFVQFVHKGETYKQRLPEGATKEEAAKIEIQWKHSLFFSTHLPEKETVLWYQFVESVYLPHVKANNSQESLDKALVICKAAMPFIGQMPIDEIKPKDIERFKDVRMRTPTQHGRKRMAATIHREMSIISRVFTLAERNELVLRNPCRLVDLPKFDNIQNRILRLEDEERFLYSVRCHMQRDIVTTALYTGLRKTDLLGLTKKHVDLVSDEVRVYQSKTQHWVTIPILPRLKPILEKRMDSDYDLLFPSGRTGKKLTSIRGSIQWACKRAGIPKLGIRDLRRTFGTRLHENGFDDKTIADLLGHVGLRTVHRYKRGTEIKRKAILSLEYFGNPTKMPTTAEIDLFENGLNPNKALVEMRRIELLASALRTPLVIH